LGLLVIIIVFGYLFGKDVIDRKYPNVIKTQKELKVPPVFQIDDSKLPIIIGIDDILSNPIDTEKLIDIFIYGEFRKILTG
jgi:hypothetical protein